MPRIIQNAIYIPEIDKWFNSVNVHDYTGHRFPDGREYFIDGGREYNRSLGNFELVDEGKVELCHLDERSSDRDIINNLLWGHRGKTGDQPLTFTPIRLLEKGHVDALLKLSYLSPLVRSVCEYWKNTFEVEHVDRPLATLSGPVTLIDSNAPSQK